MTLDGFLTIFALGAAVLAVMPAAERLRLSLTLELQLLLGTIALCAVVYLEMFDVFGRSCSLPLGRFCDAITLGTPGHFTPQQAAFLVVLVWLFAAYAAHRMAKPGARSLRAISKMVDDLIYEQRFAELTSFVEPYLPFVDRVALRALPLQRLAEKCADWRNPTAALKRQMVLGNAPMPQSAVLRTALTMVGWLGAVLPAQKKGAELHARDVMRALSSSRALTAFVVTMRPYFGIALMKSSSIRSSDYCEAYLGSLIRQKGSVLYQELSNNNQLGAGHRYFLAKQNRLLCYLFGNARTAEGLYAWKPLGDYAERLLKPGIDPEYVAKLNRSQFNAEAEATDDPIWVILTFFDLMVSEAAHQGIAFHMWLHYLPYIVQGLAESYDPKASGIDPESEFPTLGCRLIYEAFHNLGEWVHLAVDVPPKELQQRDGRADQSIPREAAKALGRALEYVLLSNGLPVEFRASMVVIVMRDVKRLPLGSGIRAELVNALSTGGGKPIPAEFKPRFRNLFGQADAFLQVEVSDLAAALGAPID